MSESRIRVTYADALRPRYGFSVNEWTHLVRLAIAVQEGRCSESPDDLTREFLERDPRYPWLRFMRSQRARLMAEEQQA